MSTLDQDLEKNKADILHFANQRDFGKVHFVEEVASGKNPWRQRLIAQVQTISHPGRRSLRKGLFGGYQAKWIG